MLSFGILPMPEGRGFLPSLRGFPVSSRCASVGFRRPWSYHLSTGIHRKPCGKNVSGSIDITVVVGPTCGTRPRTHIKRKGFKYMPTVKTAFGTGVPLLNLDQQTTIPSCFVLQLSDKLAPSDIADGGGWGVVLLLRLDIQT